MKLTSLLLVMTLTTVGCSATGLFSGGVPSEGRLIDSVSAADFDYGVMAVGRPQDLNLHRGDGLGLVDAPALSGYMNMVLAKLVAQSPLHGTPARAYIQATPEWGASASADANIYVNLGLLMELDSEDELAAVLAHELGHVILGHHSTDVIARSQQQFIALTEIAASIEEELIEEDVVDEQNVGDEDVTEQQNYLLQLNTAVVSPGWNRKQETEADILGTDILIAAGYNKVAALTVLKKQSTIERATAAAAAAESASAGPAVQVGTNSADTTTALINYGVAKFGQSMSNMFQSLSRKHRTADARLELAQNYINREYRRAPRPKLRAAEWETLVGHGQIKQVFDNYTRAFDAEEKLVAGDIAGAERDIMQAVTGPTSDHAYPRFIFYNVRLQQGDQAKAMLNLEMAFKSSEPSVKIYETASTVHLEAGRVTEAVDLLELAYDKFDRTPMLLPGLIRAYRMAGRTDLANQLLVQCTLEHPELRALCRGAEPAEEA